MGMNPISPGLRLRNRTNDVVKVQLHIPAGEEITVPDEATVLGLERSGLTPAGATATLPGSDAEVEPVDVGELEHSMTDDEVAEVAEKVAPVKKAAAKRPARKRS